MKNRRQLMNFLLSSILILISVNSTAESFKLAPNFSLPEIYNGKTISLEDYRGKVVLVDFWASWCGPCKVSLPEYDKLRNKLQSSLPNKGFEVLAINVDGSKKEAMAFLNRHQLKFPILKESSGSSQRHYGIMAMPTSFLIDKQGRIRIAHAGFSNGYIDVLEKEILALVDEGK